MNRANDDKLVLPYARPDPNRRIATRQAVVATFAMIVGIGFAVLALVCAAVTVAILRSGKLSEAAAIGAVFPAIYAVVFAIASRGLLRSALRALRHTPD